MVKLKKAWILLNTRNNVEIKQTWILLNTCTHVKLNKTHVNSTKYWNNLMVLIKSKDWKRTNLKHRNQKSVNRI